jgi:DNA repair protein RadA/Sms
MGKCPQCQEWNTFVEEVTGSGETGRRTLGDEDGAEGPRLVGEIMSAPFDRMTTGVSEFDRVLGGGLVKGSLVLIGGEPGIGKSTLLTEIAGKISKIATKEKVLYVSGEESSGQIADRCRRLGIDPGNFFIYHETSWSAIQAQLKKLRPAVVIIDSIQTTFTPEIDSAPGTVSQIREVTFELMNYCKASGTTAFVIGHITKEGAIAGPKVLEHMVDVVIYFEGDQQGYYRVLRAMKNRFGNTNEVGIFEMTGTGLQEVKNPSQYFLDATHTESFGRSLTAIIEGSRTLLAEIQALVVENKYGTGRRTTQGVDPARVSMLIAVIEKYCELPLGFSDIYVNVAGGMKLNGTDADIGIVASLMSSFRGRKLPESTVFIGEVGLTGDVRTVRGLEIRLKELAQLGYKRVFTSEKAERDFKGKYAIEIVGVGKIAELQGKLF